MKTLLIFTAFAFTCPSLLFSQQLLSSTPPAVTDTIAARQMLEAAQRLLEATRFEQALDTAELAIRLNAGTSVQLDEATAKFLDNLSRKCYAAQKFNLTRRGFLAAHEIWLRLNKYEDAAICTHGAGIALIQLGENREARKKIEKGLNIRLAQNINRTGADSLNLARSYSMIGVATQNMGLYKEALENYEKSLALKERVSGPNTIDVYHSCLNMGGLYFELKRLNDAEYYFERSRKIVLQWPDKKELLASVYNNLGALYTARRDYERSIDYHEAALALRIEVFGEFSLPVARSYANIGSANMDYGKFDKALEANLKALDIKSRIPDIDSVEIAICYLSIGSVYALRQDAGEADDRQKKDTLRQVLEQYYRPAERILVAQQGEGLIYLGELHSDMASVFAQLEQPDSALAYYRKCLATYTAVSGPGSPDLQRTYNSIALLYQKVIKNIPAAIQYLDSVLTNVGWAEGRGDIDPDQRFNLFESLSFKGEILASTAGTSAERAQARKYLDEALKLAERYRDDLAGSGSKSSFTQVVRKVIENSIALEMTEADKSGQHLQRVYALAAKNKAFLLFDAIQNAQSFAKLDSNLVKRENDLSKDIRYLEKLVYELQRSEDSLDRQSAGAYSRQLLELQRERTALLIQFAENYPEYKKARYDLPTTDVRTIQQSLLGREQCLLEYFVGENTIYIFVIRKDDFIVVPVDKSGFSLKAAVEGMLNGISEHYVKNRKNPGDLIRTSRQYADNAYLLYQKLVAPVDSLLTRRVIIAPDDYLGYIPFDALLSENPRSATRFGHHAYWGKKRVTSYTYSANLLRDMLSRQHPAQTANTATVAAPFCEGAKFKKEKKPALLSGHQSLSRDSLRNLEYSRDGALTIAGQLGCTPLLGQQATIESVTHQMEQSEVIYLITHGVANYTAGEYSYLGLSAPGDPAAYTRLYVKDIYGLSLRAELVVLSACETGTGELRKGEGIISLARAFAYAGAKSITTTLWSVDEQQTIDLMIRYNRLLKSGQLTKDEALWQARQNYLKDHAEKEEAHPFFWAAFIAIGNMAPLTQKH